MDSRRNADVDSGLTCDAWMVRLFALGALVLLAACDSAGPEVCFVTPDADVSPDLRRPTIGDTLRLGQPFTFVAEYEGYGDVTEIGVRVVWERPDPSPSALDSVVFELPLATDLGTFPPTTFERQITVDSLRGGALDDFDPAGQFYVAAYGEVRFSDCGGVGGGYSMALAPVTILDGPRP